MFSSLVIHSFTDCAKVMLGEVARIFPYICINESGIFFVIILIGNLCLENIINKI